MPTPDAPSGAPHRSRTVPPGPAVHPAGADAPVATLQRDVAADPVALARLLADVEPLRHDADAVVVTDADAEVVRFLAVLAVIEERAPMPAFDPDDPDMKWFAPKGVEAVPNPPTIVAGPSGAGSAGGAA